tara:strand:- start:6223 stop:6849 length:627 start_codon:yes stop_codon:yes gene_type:complete
MKTINIEQKDQWKDFILREAQYPIPPSCHGGICVDAGTNIGDFPLNHGNRFDKYICYDVFQENIEECKKNTKDLGVPVEAYQRAVWSKAGEMVEVYAYQQASNGLQHFGNSGNVGCVQSMDDGGYGWIKDNQIDLVQSITVEEIIEEYGEINLLKIDVEGSEYPFLLGKDLSKINYIVGEMHFDEQKIELIEWLKKFDKFDRRLWKNI